MHRPTLNFHSNPWAHSITALGVSNHIYPAGGVFTDQLRKFMSDLGLHLFFGDLSHSSMESICLIQDKDINYQSIVIGPQLMSMLCILSIAKKV